MEQITYKLGKLSPKQDARTLKFAKYIMPAQLPPLPSLVNWQQLLPANCGMMGNDYIGDCTCASAGHMVMTWTKNASGHAVVISDLDIIAAYAAISGYDTITHQNDNGAACLDVLNYWRNTGIGADHIEAYTLLDQSNEQQVKAAIYLFGGAYIGVELPNFIHTGPDLPIWDIPAGGPVGNAAPNPNNGHAIPLIGYNADYIYFITWGMIKRMTWRFYFAYVDEAYAVLSANDWINNGKSPAGFNLDALRADLSEIDSAT